MKYNGQELKPITTPQIFDPPKKMLVWDSIHQRVRIELVCAITMRNHYRVITLASCYDYCAEIPEEPKPKRATYLQLAEWLAKGNGMYKRKNESFATINVSFFEDLQDEEVEDLVLIRPFGATEWLEPTLENMGMEKK